MSAEDSGPLHGLRVIELGHFIAAPFCTRVLADLGADVIKVEPPVKGDAVRTWGEIPDGETSSVWWSVHGRNKRCVTANLKTEAGVDLVKKLIAEADAVVENFKPGQLARWGLGPDDIAAVNPDAILVQVSGYGQFGPTHARAAFGVVGEAVGGLRHLTGYPKEESDLPPVRTGVSIGDSVTGLYAAIGLLAALFEKQSGRASQPRRVDAALNESVLSLLEGCLPEYGYFGKVRQPQGSTIRTTSPSNAYPTSDGRWFLIGANSDALFRRLCEVMEHPELADDPRYIDNPARVNNAEALDAEIAEWSKTKTLAELEVLVAGGDIPSCRIYDMADVAADEQFRARGMVHEVMDPRLGKVLHPGVVPMMGGGVRWTGADIGAHNEEVYTEVCGLDAASLKNLKEEGTI